MHKYFSYEPICARASSTSLCDSSASHASSTSRTTPYSQRTLEGTDSTTHFHAITTGAISRMTRFKSFEIACLMLTSARSQIVRTKIRRCFPLVAHSSSSRWISLSHPSYKTGKHNGVWYDGPVLKTYSFDSVSQDVRTVRCDLIR